MNALRPGAVVRGPIFPEPVEVIQTLPRGSSLKILGRGLKTNQFYDPILSPEQLAVLVVSPEKEPYDGDPTRFRLGIEALRLGLAYEYDPYFSLSIARVDPLPHQIEAVYHYFLSLPRIRFLLADDPGAGKTIMAGLLLKELKTRGLVKRTLIVAPANLCFQWQREMKEKFRENFEVIRGDVLRANYGQNPWQEKSQVVTSVSWVSRIDEARESLLRARWDLVIVDEAHKMSAYSADKKTLAFQLGEALSEQTDHYLLMTATPHKGDPENFRLFLSLLDKDVYGDVKSLEEAMRRQSAPFYLRRIKEALVSFPDPDDGVVRKLFTRREVQTIEFKLDDEEWALYDAVTRYVEDQSMKAAEEDTARARALGFTMAMLQRRLASSVHACRKSLERMRDRRQEILDDPDGWKKKQIEKKLPDDFEDLTEEEQEQIIGELEGLVASYDPADLKREIADLNRLIVQAKSLEDREVSTKLSRLRDLLTERHLFTDPKMKILIFTEHKESLDYLMKSISGWGLQATQIHGGMKAGDRDTLGTRIYAEREFKEEAQVLVATEAAGEGINLQFCWLMVNYDIPWNPVRLDQRIGRIHRYGQERDCLIFNFVAVNTREGRVLKRLHERLEEIRRELGTDQVFDVVGDVFPQNMIDRLFRDLYARKMDEKQLSDRIARDVSPDRFRQITEHSLEKLLAKRDINLGVIIGKRAEAVERRLVPEVIEKFFLEAAPIAGIQPKAAAKEDGIYRIGKTPRSIIQTGDRLEPRFGRIGREYKNIVFDKTLLQKDPTLEWVTPGHPLFEALREHVSEKVRDDLRHGAVFTDLNRDVPARLDVFAASIKDGAGHTLHRRLFVVETSGAGSLQVRQPTIFLDFAPAPTGATTPDDSGWASRDETEQFLVQHELIGFLGQEAKQREKEVAVISDHLEISLRELINRQQLRLADLIERKQSGDTTPGLDGLISQAESHIDALNERLDRRRHELSLERNCTIGDIDHLGRAWVLPFAEASKYQELRRDTEIEQIAMRSAEAYERERGRLPEDVSSQDRGFDLLSRNPATEEVRFIEVKGRAGIGEVALTRNEYDTAGRLRAAYWLYVVYNCGLTPELHAIQNPCRMEWRPVDPVVRWRIQAESVLSGEFQAVDPLEEMRARIGRFNVVVEGTTDAAYLRLAAERLKKAKREDLLAGGEVRFIECGGTKGLLENVGILKALARQDRKFIVILDNDLNGRRAAEGLKNLGLQKNKDFVLLERTDYRDASGQMWDVEIEDFLPESLLASFMEKMPLAKEERRERGTVVKYVIRGKIPGADGQDVKPKDHLLEHVRGNATAEDMKMLGDLLRTALKAMGVTR